MSTPPTDPKKNGEKPPCDEREQSSPGYESESTSLQIMSERGTPLDKQEFDWKDLAGMTKASILTHGAGAGVASTGTMTLAMALFKATGLLGEPPPKRLTRRTIGRLLPRGAPLDAATLIAHVGFGAAMGLGYYLLPRRFANPLGGAAFGLAVWGVSYLGWAPKLGLMPSPSRDRPGRPTSMILAHLVFGATLGLLRQRSERRQALRRAGPESREPSPPPLRAAYRDHA